MHYYMEVEDGIIICVGMASEPIYTEITESEYANISRLMTNPPTTSSKLTENLEWVLSDELDDAEALSILTGEET